MGSDQVVSLHSLEYDFDYGRREVARILCVSRSSNCHEHLNKRHPIRLAMCRARLELHPHPSGLAAQAICTAGLGSRLVTPEASLTPRQNLSAGVS